MKNFWNERYSESEYAYGIDPNIHFKTFIQDLKPGSLLLPAEGEGRNAAFAAKLGWHVSAFDYSEEAQKKAWRLFEKEGVDVDYAVSDAESFEADEKYNLIALVFAHFPPEMREKAYAQIFKYLSAKGQIFLVGYHKRQIKNDTGGPKNEAMLFDEASLRADFSDFNIISIEEKEMDLQEGDYHKGKSDVIIMHAKNK